MPKRRRRPRSPPAPAPAPPAPAARWASSRRRRRDRPRRAAPGPRSGRPRPHGAAPARRAGGRDSGQLGRLPELLGPVEEHGGERQVVALQRHPAQPDEHVGGAAQHGLLALGEAEGALEGALGRRRAAPGSARGHPRRSRSRGRRRCARPARARRGRRRSGHGRRPRSPMVHDASPERAEAAARTRWSSSAARSKARSAWKTVAVRVAVDVERQGRRYISTEGATLASSSRIHDHELVVRQSQLPLDVVQPLRHAAELVARHQAADQADGEHRPVADHRVREGVGPGADHGLAPELGAAPGWRARPARQPARRHRPPARAARPARGHRPPGTTRLARRCSPATRSGWVAEQVRAEDVGEQVVVAVPAALVVERHDEQVAALQRLQHLRRRPSYR